ncbi:MAG: hypothetical protein ACLSFW_24235, partial [Bacteroides cellulosilyticus]
TKPYEPMLNLFAAYADEEQTEVQVVESRPSSGRAPSASRKKKGMNRKCSISSPKRTCTMKPPCRKT